MKIVVKNHVRLCLTVSAIIIGIALILSIFGWGMKWGIEFAGGTIIKYDMGGQFEVSDIERALQNEHVREYQIAKSGDNETQAQIRVRSDAEQSDVLRGALDAALSATYPDMAFVAAESVGAAAGRDIVLAACYSILTAIALVFVYTAIRFDVFAGLAAGFGMLHDVLIVCAFMVLFRAFMSLNITFIAAMLATMGYSVYNTAVLFARIRENNQKAGVRTLPREQIVDISVTETLTRTLSISLTMLLMVAALCVFGVGSIRALALPLIIGIVSSVYSSHMISGYLWAWLLHRRTAAKPRTKKA